MLDLDKYINNKIEVKLLGREVQVKEPTIQMIMEIDKIERDMDKDNLKEKRIDVAEILINHNDNGIIFSKEDLYQMPFEALNVFIDTIARLRYEADADPN